ncbi:hypothetical protein [Micromonospora sp. NPDC005087]|uniref:hypothetical protein n=1 Tax=Micromonospora sp. NPDC005087 TaxID=3364225 RepID=UPI0036947D7F
MTTEEVTANTARYDSLQQKYDRLRLRAQELEELVDTYAAAIEELRRQRDEALVAREPKVVDLGHRGGRR